MTDGQGPWKWLTPRQGMLVRFRGMASGVRWWQKGSLGILAQGASAIGAPSAGLSLGGLHACRARLRFTRRIKASTRGPSGKKTRKRDTGGLMAATEKLK
jgi:hypothetical protein